MSGHSHAKKIRRQKEATDQKRGQVFSKMARLISVAAKGGGDPMFNSTLKITIDKAKELNMPAENIERAIKRGTGELAGEKLEEVLFEAYGPGGAAIIIEGITDNKNRVFNEIKQILSQNNGKLAGEGSVKWMFKRKGYITINFQFSNSNFQTKEKLELATIEAGAEDIRWDEDILNVYTKPEELEKVKKNLEERAIKIDGSSLEWIAKEEIPLKEKDNEACQKLFESLDENEDVQAAYSNIKFP